MSWPAKIFSRKLRAREVLTAAALTSAGALLLLFARPLRSARADELCVKQMPLPLGATYLRNCDSFIFLRLAQNPERLMESDSIWQSRPGYAALGWVSAIPFRVADVVIRRVALSRFVGMEWYEPSTEPEFRGLILLNWLLLVCSVALFCRSLGKTALSVSLLLPASMLVVNGVTRGYFWTPHLQIFNIFVRVLSVHLGSAVLDDPEKQSTKWVAGCGLLLGFASLAYGAFVIAMATTVLALILALRLIRRPFVRPSLIGLGCYAMPMLAWISFVLGQRHHFYSHETAAYREFVWLGDAIRDGGTNGTKEILRKLELFTNTLRPALLIPLGLLAASSIYAKMAGVKSNYRRWTNVTVASAIFFCCSTAFFAFMGFYTARLTWELVPPLLFLLALQIIGTESETVGLAKKLLQFGLPILTGVYVGWTLISDPTPYLLGAF